MMNILGGCLIDPLAPKNEWWTCNLQTRSTTIYYFVLASCGEPFISRL